jgi:hypothetical protein
MQHRVHYNTTIITFIVLLLISNTSLVHLSHTSTHPPQSPISPPVLIWKWYILPHPFAHPYDYESGIFSRSPHPFPPSRMTMKVVSVYILPHGTPIRPPVWILWKWYILPQSAPIPPIPYDYESGIFYHTHSSTPYDYESGIFYHTAHPFAHPYEYESGIFSRSPHPFPPSRMTMKVVYSTTRHTHSPTRMNMKVVYSPTPGPLAIPPDSRMNMKVVYSPSSHTHYLTWVM